MAVCPYCGASVKDGDSFCAACGTRLTEVRPYRSAAPAGSVKKKLPMLLGCGGAVLAAMVLLVALTGSGKKNSAPLTPAAAAAQNSAIPVKAYDPSLRQWWEGDWYGWCAVSGGTGDYVQWKDGRWDCMANIAMDGSGSGTLLLWDEHNTKRDPFADFRFSVVKDAVSGQNGVGKSESGRFLEKTLSAGDVVLDPGRYDLENMIVMEGKYTDSVGSFSYRICLRPWGQRWEDVEMAKNLPCAPEQMYPKLYKNWYLPAVEGGCAMPNVLGSAMYIPEKEEEAHQPSRGGGNTPAEDILYTFQWLKTQPDCFTYEHYTYMDVADYIQHTGTRDEKQSTKDTDVYTWTDGNVALTVYFRHNSTILDFYISGITSDSWSNLNPFDRLPAPVLDTEFSLSAGGITLSGSCPGETWYPYYDSTGSRLVYAPSEAQAEDSDSYILLKVFDSAAAMQDYESRYSDASSATGTNIGGYSMNAIRFTYGGSQYLRYAAQVKGKQVCILVRDLNPDFQREVYDILFSCTIE